MGSRARQPDRLPRRLRARRGGRPGGVRGGGRALAARRRPRQPARLAGDHGTQPGDRPDPSRAHAGGEDRAARDSGGDRGRTRPDDDPGRAARADLHLLPPGAGARRPGRADAAHARRAEHRGDRPRLPGPDRDDGEAAGTGEEEDPRGSDPVPGPAGPPAPGPARRRARGRLSDLQRGLRRPVRARGRGDPARAGAGRADARRARRPRVAGADAGQRRAACGPLRRRRDRAPARPGPLAVGRASGSRRASAASTGRSPSVAAART